jgi:hypothetical protein
VVGPKKETLSPKHVDYLDPKYNEKGWGKNKYFNICTNNNFYGTNPMIDFKI